MLSSLHNHPFAVEAFFKSSLVISFAVPAESLKSLLPPCLEVDTFQNEWGFVAMAMVQTKDLRPKGFPSWMGNDFFLTGYRIFVRYKNAKGKNLRGLYILKSETDKKKMEWLGNIFTNYKYSTIDVALQEDEGMMKASSVKAGFEVEVKLAGGNSLLPATSPFKDWKETRRFAGPLPFTFSYNKEKQEVVIVEGVRENWIPEPVEVISCKVPFVESLNLPGMQLANAFIIKNIPYHWKKKRGRKMAAPIRSPFQGITNIIRFNWHFYLLSIAAILTLLLFLQFVSNPFRLLIVAICLLIFLATTISLVASWYVYDISGLYKLQ